MKKLLSTLAGVAALFSSATMLAQTSGTLTVAFTPTPSTTSFYSGTQNTLAAWIQSSTGTFVKTNLRYYGGGTNDHLPTWTTKSAGSTTGAAGTGATKSGFAAVSYSWNGTNAAGTQVADGAYSVIIENCWNHGTTGIHTSTVSFTKGTTSQTVTPVATANLKNVTVIWTPASTVGIDEAVSVNPVSNVYPNPTEGVFNIDYKNATEIKVLNTLGAVVYEEKINHLTEGTKSIDLTRFNNGLYFVNVSNGTNSTNHKVVLSK